MGLNVKRNWDTDTVTCPSASIAKKLTELAGGESITLTSLAGVTNYHYIGPKEMVELSRGFKLQGKQSMSITLGKDFGPDNYIEIWAMPTNANDQVTYAKIPDFAELVSDEQPKV